MKNIFKNQYGWALLPVVILSVLAMILSTSLIYSTQNTVKVSGVRRTSVNALNIAEAGKEHFYSLLRSGTVTLTPNNKTVVFNQKNLGSSSAFGNYTVACSTNSEIDTFWVESTGKFQNSSKTIMLKAVFLPEIDPTKGEIRGAVTALSIVDIKGNIVIDGRDYDHFGSTIVDNGLFGISTCKQVTSFDKASSSVGGNGIAPIAGKTLSDPAIISQIIQENGTFGARLASPEIYFGVKSGAFDKYKTTTLSDNFSGVYYVENDVELPKNECHGIIIVHNSFGNATLRINGGSNFKGLIIADRLDKINGTADVLGAIVLISPMGVTMEGLGNANIKYSSSTIEKVHKLCSNMQYRLVEEEWLEK